MWSFWLWLKEAYKGLFRNFLMNSFALLLSIVCFGLFSIFTMISVNAKYISAEQEEKISIILYLKDNIVDYQSVEDKIKEVPEIKEHLFISKEDAYEEMRVTLGDREKMLTELGFNPLPASFEIKLNNTRDIKKVVKIIESWGIDKDIKYGEEYLDNFFKVTDKINQLSFSIILLMSVATGAVLFSSIRMNILNRNKEIEIKNLIGAGSLNIKIPFILEATLLTVISATVVLVSVFFGYDYILNFITQGFPTVNFLSRDEIIKNLVPPMYFLAFAIGIFSSLLSTQRYLKRH